MFDHNYHCINYIYLSSGFFLTTISFFVVNRELDNNLKSTKDLN